MNKQMQAYQPQNVYNDSRRWDLFLALAANNILGEIFSDWVPKPWAASLAWLVVLGVYLIILCRKKRQLITRHWRLFISIWPGGAILSYFVSLQPKHTYPLWVSGIFLGVMTSLPVWAKMKQKQNRLVS